jgi:hypothetical protein
MPLKILCLLILTGILVACIHAPAMQAVLTPDLEKPPARDVRDMRVDETGYVRRSNIWADAQGKLWITATARIYELPPIVEPVLITRTLEGIVIELTTCPACQWERRRDDAYTTVLASLPILEVIKP